MCVVGVVCLVVAAVMLAISLKSSKNNKLTPKERKGSPEIAVLIAARDESAVIEGLLKSLQKQTVEVKPEDIYVIVETVDDPTIDICKKYGNTVVLRKDLSKQRKGYALDEAVRAIRKAERRYNMYFVFDADNLLAEDFVEKMLESYRAGYEIATGYRYPKNGNENVITAVSALTFSMINALGNRARAKERANIVFSGTGFFVTGDLVEEWQGWPFHSLTEDYEMSLYATLHGLATTYNEEARFYDEQPTRFGQTVLQRVRWIKGYFTARKKYVPLMRVKKRADNIGSIVHERIGVKPAIMAIIGVVLILVDAAGWMIYLGKGEMALAVVVGVLIFIYLVLMVATIVILRQEKAEFIPKIRVQAVLFNPVYLVTYVPCALKAILSKNVTWKKIEHGKK